MARKMSSAWIKKNIASGHQLEKEGPSSKKAQMAKKMKKGTLKEVYSGKKNTYYSAWDN